MPLLKGKKNIGRNIKKLLEDRYKRDQAIAIALDVSRRRKKKK